MNNYPPGVRPSDIERAFGDFDPETATAEELEFQLHEERRAELIRRYRNVLARYERRLNDK